MSEASAKNRRKLGGCGITTNGGTVSTFLTDILNESKDASNDNTYTLINCETLL